MLFDGSAMSPTHCFYGAFAFSTHRYEYLNEPKFVGLSMNRRLARTHARTRALLETDRQNSNDSKLRDKHRKNKTKQSSKCMQITSIQQNERKQKPKREKNYREKKSI